MRLPKGSRDGAGVSQRGDGGLPDPQTGPQQGKQSQVKWLGMEGEGGPCRQPPGFSQDRAPWPWGCRSVPPPLPHPTFIAVLCCHLPCSASSAVMEQQAVLTETSLGASRCAGCTGHSWGHCSQQPRRVETNCLPGENVEGAGPGRARAGEPGLGSVKAFALSHQN